MIGKRTAARNLDQRCDSAPGRDEHARAVTGRSPWLSMPLGTPLTDITFAIAEIRINKTQ
jgi:hypothetical protein